MAVQGGNAARGKHAADGSGPGAACFTKTGFPTGQNPVVRHLPAVTRRGQQGGDVFAHSAHGSAVSARVSGNAGQGAQTAVAIGRESWQ